jgi:hypothetical protein
MKFQARTIRVFVCNSRLTFSKGKKRRGRQCAPLPVPLGGSGNGAELSCEAAREPYSIKEQA